MADQYFKDSEFDSITQQELGIANDVFENMVKSGLKSYVMLVFDIQFTSNKASKLKKLSEFLQNHFGYKMDPLKKGIFKSTIEGKTTEIMIDNESIFLWVSEMVKIAKENDCKFGDWGSLVDYKKQKTLDFYGKTAKEWFDNGINYFEDNHLTLAFQNFRASVLIDPQFADGFDAMGSAELDLFLYKAALENYNKAIRLAPEEYSYYLNRGASKDYLGDYPGAITDYDLVISKYPKNAKTYFNRGNTKKNMGDLKGACEDWHKAKELGADYADLFISKYCQ